MPRLRPLALLLLGAALAPAAEPAAPLAPVPDRVRQDLFFLAGDECEGRGLETEGIQKAAQRIADTFKAAGLQPAPGADGYFQPFPVYTGKPSRGPTNSLTLSPTGGEGKPRPLTLDRDFVPLAGTATVAGGLVFAGYGITAPGLKYDDYAGLDVAGKWVVVLRRTPRADDTDKPFDPDGRYGSLASKLATARANKAAGLIFVNDVTYAKAGDKPVEPSTLAADNTLPALFLHRPVAESLLPPGKTLAAVETAVGDTGKPDSFALPWAGEAEVSFRRPSLACKNVVGVLPGAGPLADETVVVGAHYDHLGRGEGGRGASRDAAPQGKLHYGADDNASGTTGLLELARRLGANKGRQGRRVVFIAFSGEERGLFGSLHYCNQPLFPLEKTVFMLNMDMIGRASPAADAPKDGSPKDRLVVYGTGTGAGLDAAAELFNARVGFNLIKVPTGSGPSDHESFFLKKVPVLFLFTGTHRDYHTPADTPDKVNLPGLVKAVDLAQLLTEHFAAVLERPKFEATKGGWYDPTEEKPKSARKGGGPKIGIMPGNYEAEDGGVLVEDVVPGGAAEKAGLKKGDRIVGLGGKPVKNIEGYMAAMAAQKPGVEIDAEVVRGDKKVTLKVTPK